MHFEFPVDRNKAEAPLMALFGIAAILLSLFFYPRVGAIALSVFPIFALAFLAGRQSKLALFRKKYFYLIDDSGIRFCLHIFHKPTLIRWDQVQSVYSHIHEINLRLKDTGRVISLPKGIIADSLQDQFLDKIEELFNNAKTNGKERTSL
jgi:hypothetical protein